MDTQQNDNSNIKNPDHVKTNDCPASDNKKLEQRGNLRSAIAQITATIGFGVLLLGIGLILSMPTIVIGGLFNNNEELFLLDEESASWFGSIIFISQPLGSVASGFLQDIFGRKRCMMMVNIPQLIGWIIIYYSTHVFYLYSAAILLGLNLGFMEAPVLSYVGEITEPHLRGMLSSLSGSFAGIGILLECLIGALTDWRSTCAISAIVPVLAFITISLIPESPTWLIIQGRITEAEQALCWLRGWVHPVYVREEFLALLEYTKSASTKEMVTIPANVENKEPIESSQESRSSNTGVANTFVLLLQPKLHRPLRMVLIYFFISHNISLLGIRPFLVHIFKLIGMPMNPHWVLVVSGGLQIIGSLTGMIFMKLLGKRKVNFISLLTCVICCYMLAVSIKLGDVIPWIPFGLFCLLFFAAGFGVIPLPWVLLSEVFPLEGRGIAGGIAAAASYFQGFIITKTYINFSSWFGLHGTLCIYGTIGLFGLFYLYYCLPETEGKTLEQIEEFFRDRKAEQKPRSPSEVMA
ncbi:facilitated trehalose transporter Tret1-like [Lycorma delicatula]|uniref:facilitated trehalose transporter Tret1-like n=1 Tax=Lycorma delicatula TaxID=130591 RepID=UPI003F5136BB